MSGTYESKYGRLEPSIAYKSDASGKMAVGKIFGDDNRERVENVRELPYSAIWRLLIMVDGEAYRGTGYMIKPGIMLTAGHNIYDCDAKKYSDEVYAIGRDGMRHRLYDAFIPDEYKKCDMDIYDWAVAKIAVVPGETYSCIGLLNMDDGQALDIVNQRAEIAGFPVEVRNVTTHDMYREEGTIMAYDKDRKILNYQIDTSGGNSGSPVLVYKNTVPYAIGIHVRNTENCNIARAIDNRIAEAVDKLSSTKY